MNRIGNFLFLGAMISISGAVNVRACSVCRCGDNAFQFSDRGFVVADQTISHRFGLTLGDSYSSKSNALGFNEGPGTERQREIRPSLRLAYNLLDNLSFALEAPFQYRRITASSLDGTTREASSGFGDTELSGVWMHNLFSNDGRFYTGGLSLAVTFPTGNNNIRRSDERLDEHLQVGTGAYSWQVGGALSRVTCASRYFTSLYYRRNGTNDFTYHYGNAALFNLGGQWPVTDRLSGLLQVNGRYAARDLFGNSAVDNTGGWVTYLTPGLRFDLMEPLIVSASVQIPVYQNLFGTQSEKAVLTTSLSYLF